MTAGLPPNQDSEVKGGLPPPFSLSPFFLSFFSPPPPPSLKEIETTGEMFVKEMNRKILFPLFFFFFFSRFHGRPKKGASYASVADSPFFSSFQKRLLSLSSSSPSLPFRSIIRRRRAPPSNITNPDGGFVFSFFFPPSSSFEKMGASTHRKLVSDDVLENAEDDGGGKKEVTLLLEFSFPPPPLPFPSSRGR